MQYSGRQHHREQTFAPIVELQEVEISVPIAGKSSKQNVTRLASRETTSHTKINTYIFTTINSHFPLLASTKKPTTKKHTSLNVEMVEGMERNKRWKKRTLWTLWTHSESIVCAAVPSCCCSVFARRMDSASVFPSPAASLLLTPPGLRRSGRGCTPCGLSRSSRFESVAPTADHFL